MDWNRILSFVITAERNIKLIWTTRSLFRAAMLFSSNRSASLNRPKLSNNSLIRDQKSNKHIANGYKKLVHTFKREGVQFFVAKNLAVNHLQLEALPAVQTWTAHCKRDRKAVVTWHFAVCDLQFPMKNVMLKVPILIKTRQKKISPGYCPLKGDVTKINNLFLAPRLFGVRKYLYSIFHCNLIWLYIRPYFFLNKGILIKLSRGSTCKFIFL